MKDLFQDKPKADAFIGENGLPLPDHILVLKMQEGLENENHREALAIQKELERRKRSL